MLTCRSSAIAVWADSGLILGLLLTVLGSQSDFHGCQTPRCACVLVVKTRSLGRFWPVSWTSTQFDGPDVIFTIDEPGGAFTCRSSTLTIWANSGLFRGLLLTVLGVPEQFPRLINPGVRLCVRHQHSQFWPILVHLMHYYSPFWGSQSNFLD